MEKALDQIDNAFIRIETKRRKQMSEEYFEQKLKLSEVKKGIISNWKKDNIFMKIKKKRKRFRFTFGCNDVC